MGHPPDSFETLVAIAAARRSWALTIALWVYGRLDLGFSIEEVL
jgi:hypothetical protein